MVGMNFDTLVLAPAMNTFAITAVLTPVNSQPNKPAYSCRGILSYQETEIFLDDGTKLATVSISLGIRQSEFPILPIQGDMIFVNNKNFFIDIVRADGQGGSRLVLKSAVVPVTS